MIDTLVRIERFLQVNWVREDGVTYDADTCNRVDSVFFSYILDALISHYERINRVPTSDHHVISELMRDAHMLKADTDEHFTVGHVILEKHGGYNNPTIDVIMYLKERYKNGTVPNSRTLCDVTEELEDDIISNADGQMITTYPCAWDEVDTTTTRAYVPRPDMLQRLAAHISTVAEYDTVT